MPIMARLPLIETSTPRLDEVTLAGRFEFADQS